jgi:hypothetical protein
MPLIAAQSLRRLTNLPTKWAYPAHLVAGRRVGGYRYITVQATPATDTSTINIAGRSASATSPGENGSWSPECIC